MSDKVPKCFKNPSLYVGNLPDVNEEMLTNHFKEYNPIMSKVCRDKILQKSLGYGYVNFNTTEDAYAAFYHLNFTEIVPNTQPIRVSPVLKDSSVRKDSELNLFIKNLPDGFDSKYLWQLFRDQGVISCHVPTGKDGAPLSYGYVGFFTPEEASATIEKFNGQVLGEQKLVVEPCEKRSPSETPYTNVHIRGMRMSEEEVEALAEKFGKVTSNFVPPTEKKQKLYTAINFEKPEDAKAVVDLEVFYAVRKENKTTFYEKKEDAQQEVKDMGEEEAEEALIELKASKYIKRSQFIEDKKRQLANNPDRAVFVKNFGNIPDFGETQLREIFSDCGEIESVKILKNERGISKGNGFVTFKSKDAALLALKKHDSPLPNNKVLYVAKPQTKEQRQQNMMQTQANWRQRQMAMGMPMEHYGYMHMAPQYMQVPTVSHAMPDFEAALANKSREEKLQYIGNIMYEMGRPYFEETVLLRIISGFIHSEAEIDSLIKIVKDQETFKETFTKQQQRFANAYQQ